MAAAGRKIQLEGENSALTQVIIKTKTRTTSNLPLLKRNRSVKCPPKLQIRWVPAWPDSIQVESVFYSNMLLAYLV